MTTAPAMANGSYLEIASVSLHPFPGMRTHTRQDSGNDPVNSNPVNATGPDSHRKQTYNPHHRVGQTPKCQARSKEYFSPPSARITTTILFDYYNYTSSSHLILLASNFIPCVIHDLAHVIHDHAPASQLLFRVGKSAGQSVINEGYHELPAGTPAPARAPMSAGRPKYCESANHPSRTPARPLPANTRNGKLSRDSFRSRVGKVDRMGDYLLPRGGRSACDAPDTRGMTCRHLPGDAVHDRRGCHVRLDAGRPGLGSGRRVCGFGNTGFVADSIKGGRTAGAPGAAGGAGSICPRYGPPS
jgi:hypothetical protein